jgi:hypothetical protein
MEPDVLLLSQKELATDLYPETDQSSPWHSLTFLQDRF